MSVSFPKRVERHFYDRKTLSPYVAIAAFIVTIAAIAVAAIAYNTGFEMIYRAAFATAFGAAVSGLVAIFAVPAIQHRLDRK